MSTTQTNQVQFRPISELILGDYHGAVFVAKMATGDYVIHRAAFQGGMMYSFPTHTDGWMLPVEKSQIVEFAIVEHVNNYSVVVYDAEKDKFDVIEVTDDNKHDYLPNFMVYYRNDIATESGYVAYRNEDDMQEAMDIMAEIIHHQRNGTFEEEYDDELYDDDEPYY